MKNKRGPYITREKLAYNLCMSEKTVMQWVKNGSLPGPSRDRDGTVWDWTEVEAYLDRGTAPLKIYFIESQGFIKIGCSSNIPLRLIALSVGLPMPMTLLHAMPGDFADEKELHKRFHHLRSRGEWFRKEFDLLEHINHLKNRAET